MTRQFPAIQDIRAHYYESREMSKLATWPHGRRGVWHFPFMGEGRTRALR